jgi:hypothetical protein
LGCEERLGVAAVFDLVGATIRANRGTGHVVPVREKDKRKNTEKRNDLKVGRYKGCKERTG